MTAMEKSVHPRPHPWHSLSVRLQAPRAVNVFIGITPFEAVKYELVKETGFTIVASPQHTSSVLSSLYGFNHRALCGTRTARLMPGTRGGDGDPLDICVLIERLITRGDLLHARAIGGTPTIDDGQADFSIPS